MDQLDLAVCEDELLQLGRLLKSVCDRMLAVAVTIGFRREGATAFGHTNVRFRATAIIPVMPEMKAHFCHLCHKAIIRNGSKRLVKVRGKQS
ncbi:hypothetical protein HJA83_14060 [Rhizobium bangladeshense]|uniref:hypothetical protein n=1 Tax=Rhizobium bangladeshense TaxID=1138189 RepID=UPI001C83FD2C|nr:hypothetical protein [Rhizobium bangladeshense]MBX4902440.1 hypothetical protein [Rhizobium bangladeshense]